MLNTSKNLTGFDAGFAMLDLRAKTGLKSAKVFDPPEITDPSQQCVMSFPLSLYLHLHQYNLESCLPLYSLTIYMFSAYALHV